MMSKQDRKLYTEISEKLENNPNEELPIPSNEVQEKNE